MKPAKSVKYCETCFSLKNTESSLWEFPGNFQVSSDINIGNLKSTGKVQICAKEHLLSKGVGKKNSDGKISVKGELMELQSIKMVKSWIWEEIKLNLQKK